MVSSVLRRHAAVPGEKLYPGGTFGDNGTMKKFLLLALPALLFPGRLGALPAPVGGRLDLTAGNPDAASERERIDVSDPGEGE